MLVGFLILLLAGLCQGSFGLGYKKYPPFSWAAFWGVYCLLCIVVSVGVTWILAPGLWGVIGAQEGSYWGLPLFCGALWGLSAIGFSKGIDKIGMSMVYGISMGISTVVGSVLPMIMNGAFPTGLSMAAFIAELVLTVVGVVLVTIAGVRRDGGAGKAKLGVALAIFSGLGSGAMNLGFSHSQRVSDAFSALGYSQTAVSAGKWLPVLVGGCLAGAMWCAGELSVRKEWKTLTDKGSGKRVCRAVYRDLKGTAVSVVGWNGTAYRRRTAVTLQIKHKICFFWSLINFVERYPFTLLKKQFPCQCSSHHFLISGLPL